MSAQHTPGPWITFDDPSNNIHHPKRIFVIPAYPGPTIASLCGKGIGHRDDRLVEDTARLIAAAPDLLAALKALTAQIESGAFDNIGPDHPDSAVLIARAAIEKATGQEGGAA